MLWLKLALRQPDACLRAALAMEAGYWDLRRDAASTGLQLYLGDYGRYDNGFEGENPRAAEGVVEVRIAPARLRLEKALRSALLALSRLPVLSLLFKGGLYLYLILLSLLYTLKTRRRGLVLPLMLLLYGLGLVFGPVSGNSRYFFPILALAPFLCTLSSALPRRQDPSDT